MLSQSSPQLNPPQIASAQYEILYPGSYAMVKVSMKQGQTIKAESGAMVAMSPTIEVEGKMEGGVLGALGRKFLTGESVFLQSLKAMRGDGEVLLAPASLGDLKVLDLNGANSFFVQKEGFLAADASLAIEVASQGILKGFISREGIFIQRVSGVGKLVVSSFGAIHKLTLASGETMIVDNAHLVAWSGTISYEMRKASAGLLNTITSGEGWVCYVNGPGEMYIQSRNTAGFGGWIKRFLPSGS
ncbi:MAG: TIGR00266 family protein [Thermodesulfovibrio sp.]|nr:TIGR00266 family protein [Thermodesulfovibrio sp.]